MSFNTMQSLFFSQIKTWLHENVSYVLLILFASVFEENMITDNIKKKQKKNIIMKSTLQLGTIC